MADSALVTIILTVVKAIVVLLAVVICGALLSWVERRLLGLWQDRYGPNRVGPFGAFQLGADMVKMFFKEDWTPPFADKMIFTLAPVIAMGALLVAFAIVPITPTWGVADLNIGILFFFAMAGLTVYAVLFAGWSSNNKFALLGSLRASAQTISYEVFLALSLMGIVAQVGSFNMRDIVQYQIDNVWFIIPQFFGFCTFIIAGVAVTHRHPFDQPEAEQELADGYHIEYAGMNGACSSSASTSASYWSRRCWRPCSSAAGTVRSWTPCPGCRSSTSPPRPASSSCSSS